MGPRLIHRVIARLNVGGPAIHVVNLTRALDHGPWRTRLVTGRVSPDEGDMAYYAREHGVEVTYIGGLSREISPLDDLRTLIALVRLFRRERPEIVHTHTAKAGTLGRLAALLAGVPVRIHTYHGHVLGGDYFGPAKTRLFLEIERQLARVTSRLVVLTDGQARQMAEELRVAPRESFAVVPLGLELETLAAIDRPETAARTRRALGIDAGERVVGIVGRMVPVKNHELYLEAMAALAASGGRPVRGLVIGAGGREGELKERARALGLAERILWLGWRRDLAELYPAMDVLALTSHDEGTPVALLEALAAGTPVVARDVGGVREVLEHAGSGGLVARAAGSTEWADALAAAMGGDESGGTPSSGGLDAEVRARVASYYSIERLAADMAALYEREAGAHGRPRVEPRGRD